MKKNTLLTLGLLLCSHTVLLSQNWTVGGNNLSAAGKLGSNNNTAVVFETNNKERGRVTAGGMWGFGVGTPGAKVHINSASGQEALIVEANGKRQLTIPAAGGVAVGGAVTPPPGGLLMTGNLGIGSHPGSYKTKITHGTFGFNLENSTTLNDWELWANGNGLSLYANGNFRGNFDPNSGAYSSASDKRLKTNIGIMPLILEKISQLKPVEYQWKQPLGSTYYGFIAQEVQDVFPYLVTHTVNKERNLDVYTLNYGGFAVISIKAIQEMQQIIETLESRIARLEAAQNVITKNN